MKPVVSHCGAGVMQKEIPPLGMPINIVYRRALPRLNQLPVRTSYDIAANTQLFPTTIGNLDHNV